MSKVQINLDIVRWALDRADLKAEAISTRELPVVDWLNNSKVPTHGKLREFAEKTMAPYGYFFLKEPPAEQMPIALFRTESKMDKLSVNLLELVYTMQRRQDWYREYIQEEDGAEPLDFVGKYAPEDDPKDIATAIRNSLGLEENWARKLGEQDGALKHLRSVMQDTGVLVFRGRYLGVGYSLRRKLDVDEFSGFVLVDEYAPLVFINANDWPARQMFTLAHELAHIALGRDAAFNLRDLKPASNPIEKACNRIAAEFLVPENLLKEEWTFVSKRPDRFQRLNKLFRVSAIVVARRAEELGLISTDTYFEFYNQSREAYWAKVAAEKAKQAQSPTKKKGSFFNNEKSKNDRHFLSALKRATFEGSLLYSDAYKLTGYKSSTFKSLLERVP